jgi:amino acid adenylation domain-containing protein
MKSFHDILLGFAQNTPQKPAVVSTEAALTYADLYRACRNIGNAVLQRLGECGALNTTFIPIVFDRNYVVPVTIQALLCINKAYVPLDPATPDERLRLILRDVNSPIVITSRKHSEKVKAAGNFIVLEVEDLIQTESKSDYAVDAAGPKDPVYMIYTSGTTGIPKGVINIREGLMNRIEWMRDEYQLSAERVFILKTPYTFDVSVWELTGPFTIGATLVVGSSKLHQKINELLKLVDQYKVTDIHFVPSVLQIYLPYLADNRLSSIKNVYCSGEALSTELTKKFFESGISANLYNLYGPTEASIEVSHWQCSTGDSDRYPSTPIGRPIRNTYFYVVDDKGRLLPDGEAGELLIGGVGVAKGYYNSPQLTAEKFIDDPFAPQRGKLYKTGDLVRRDKSGIIEFLGRIDFQVKINGQRVELAEIENNLLKIDGIRGATVLYEKSILCAFVEKARSIEDQELLDILKKHLPSYMVPSRIITVESLPLNSSGKTDRKALKELI